MTCDKYEILENEDAVFFGRKLLRIVALRDFEIQAGNRSCVGQTYYGSLKVKKGDIGGYIEGPWNLSQEGNCWIGKGAAVFGRACVSENAYVHGVAKFETPTATVRGRARVYGKSEVKDFAQIRDNACIGGCSVIRQFARVEDYVNVIDSDVGGYVCLIGDYLVRGADKILDYNAKPVRIYDQSDLKRALISVDDARRCRANSAFCEGSRNEEVI